MFVTSKLLKFNRKLYSPAKSMTNTPIFTLTLVSDLIIKSAWLSSP